MSKDNDKTSSKPEDTKTTQRKRAQKEIAMLREQIEQLTDDVKRERADFMNYRRRMELDRMQVMDAAKTEVMRELLPIFDDLERALGVTPKDLQDHSWVKGVNQVYRQTQTKLAELGLERIDCLHQPFNPEQHEAVGFEDDGGDDELVTEELRAGYTLGEQTLRPSMVKVGKPLKNEQNKDKE